MNAGQHKGVGIIDVAGDTYVFRTPDDNNGAPLTVGQSVSFDIDESDGRHATNVQALPDGCTGAEPPLC